MAQLQDRNLLIIAYEFPPSAGGGVQRLTKFARYLPYYGWKTHVLAGTPVWGRPFDETLVKEVEGIFVDRIQSHDIAACVARTLRPLKSIRRRHVGGTGADQRLDRAAAGTPLSTRLVRKRFLDSAALWSRRVPTAALKMHDRIGFDAVMASGPPHSALLAGMKAAQKMSVPFIVDARDPWAGNPGYRWPDSPRMDDRSLRSSRAVMRAASLVVAVSDPIAAEARGAGAVRTVTIPNGFDPSDLPCHRPEAGPLHIVFLGHFYGVTDPTPFLDAVALAVGRKGSASDVRIDILGPAQPLLLNALAARGLNSHVSVHGFLPHAEALEVVSHADVGLVVIADRPGAEAIYTGKLFEYLGMRLPILLVGPVCGVAADLIRDSHSGIVVPYGDPVTIADALESIAQKKALGELGPDIDETVRLRFDRRHQAAALARLLDEVAR